jgi:hypothetical protein
MLAALARGLGWGRPQIQDGAGAESGGDDLGSMSDLPVNPNVASYVENDTRAEAIQGYWEFPHVRQALEGSRHCLRSIAMSTWVFDMPAASWPLASLP